jgi:hypothetical protein
MHSSTDYWLLATGYWLLTTGTETETGLQPAAGARRGSFFNFDFI